MQLDLLGPVALSIRPTGVQIALPAPLPRRLADLWLLRLAGVQLYRLTAARTRGQGVYPRPILYAGRGGDHALARDYGRQGAAVGCGIPDVHSPSPPPP